MLELTTRRVFVAVLALGLFTLAARSVTDPDVWWHLRTGQLMLQNHSLFHADPYSFTRLGQPWIDHEWLSQILVYGLYRLAGFGGLIVAFAVVIAIALLLVFQRCPGRPYLAALFTLWGAVATAPAWGVRPQMFSFLLASIFLAILEASEKRTALLWWTVPLMLLWANLHAGYAIGLAFLALFLLGEAIEGVIYPARWTHSAARLKTLTLVFAVCVAIVAFNPYRLRIYSYPFQTLRSSAMQRFIQEWASPNFHDPMYLPLLFLLLALPAALVLSPRRLRVREIVLLMAVVPAALISIRHIPLLILILVPLLASLGEAWLQQRGAWFLQIRHSLPTRRIVAANILVLVAFTDFTLLRVRHVVRSQAEVEAQHFPQAAAAFLQRERIPGPILNHYNFGGYFIWRLYPQYRVFCDGRADVYGDEFLNDFASAYYLTGEAAQSWTQPLNRWGVRAVVLPADAPLTTALLRLPEWKLVYSDSQAVVVAQLPPRAP